MEPGQSLPGAHRRLVFLAVRPPRSRHRLDGVQPAAAELDVLVDAAGAGPPRRVVPVGAGRPAVAERQAALADEVVVGAAAGDVGDDVAPGVGGEDAGEQPARVRDGLGRVQRHAPPKGVVEAAAHLDAAVEARAHGDDAALLRDAAARAVDAHRVRVVGEDAPPRALVLDRHAEARHGQVVEAGAVEEEHVAVARQGEGA